MGNIKHKQVFHFLEEWAPKRLAFDWDRVGLQVGSEDAETKKIMITLDVLEDVVDEAIENNVNLILSHHPLIFKPLKQIDFSSPKGKVLQKLIKHQITVYTAHTNLDIADGGVNDMLANQLGLEITGSLSNVTSENLFKLIVYVPTSHIDEVRQAFHEGGAGHIGNYSHCTFQTEGHGTFKPLEGSDPYSGTQHELSIVEEVRMESIVPEQNLSNVLQEVRRAHPYEEVAYDLYQLQNEGKVYGLGRVGILNKQMTVTELCEHVKNVFQLEGLQVIGPVDKQVNKVAILGGSGEKYIFAAKKKGVDTFITGDMTFHMAQEAMEMGLTVIDAGHYIEQVMKQATKEYLDQKMNRKIEVICSQVNTNPFRFM